MTGTDITFIKDLPDGNYTIKEEVTPEGYEPAADIHFTISDGKLVGNVDDTVIIPAAKVGEVQISKQNVYGEEIVGAKLTLTGKDANGNDIIFAVEDVVPGINADLITSGDSAELTWLSGSTPTFVKNLPDGTYVLHEVAAPSGYEVTTDMTFTVKDGVISGETGVNGTNITMMDDMILTDVEISKQNLYGKEIAGATLTLTGTDFTGRPVEFFEADVELGRNAKFVSDGDALTWVSGTTASIINALPDGTYVLHEVAAPSGYEVATDITFIIKDGELSGDVGVESDSVTMMDDMTATDVYISKQDVFSKELAGATLTLTGTDFNGEKVKFEETGVVFGDGAKFVSDGESLTWISGTTPTLVKDLPDGTYVLHEIAAPNGYEVATDITFTIEDGQLKGDTHVTSTSVTMIDEMVVTTTAPVITTTTETTTSTTTTDTDTTTTETTTSTTTTNTDTTTTTEATTTTTTTTDTTTSTTTSATTEKTTTTKKTTTKKTTTKKTTAKSTDAPKTGDAGAAVPVLVVAMAAAAAFVLRKKREDEE